ncbi:MAG: sodium-translocating pyrophosphatase, partial [Elusimicrobia bacterium]|nr:sodium-translocating pyrophosphatase [Elusimicrobiota bacterium]
MKFPFVIVMGISLLSLAVAFWLIHWVMAKDTGTPEMRKISDAIKAGAEAFLRRQNYTIVTLSSVLAAVIFVLYAFVRKSNEHDPAAPMILAVCTTGSFIAGAACSLIAGYIGMWVSIRTNIRTASAAR